MISFLKSLVDFTEPPGLIWLALTVMTLLQLRRRLWRGAVLPGGAWLLLTVTSASPVSHWLLASLENDWPPVEIANMPECDAIVVLGGGVEPSHIEPAGLHLNIGADRLFTAATLAKEGKGRLIVIGGGGFETMERIESEADGAKAWLEAWHLSSVPVQSLGRCVDTHDEAIKVAALSVKNGWKRIALVTSAFHMTRTKAVFEKAGVPVIPVPCNYLSAAMRGRQVKWIDVPNAANLSHFEVWMHEFIGMWGYRLRGWI